MPRQFSEDRLVIASHNPGKVREIGDLVAPFGIQVVSAGELDLPEPEETGDTFRANAELKALAAAQASGSPALADDSGLVVAALDGAPGIYSSRWAGPHKDFAVAMTRVEEALAGKEDRRAHFTCALSLAWPDGHVETFRRLCPWQNWCGRRRVTGASDTIPVFRADGHSTSHLPKWRPRTNMRSAIGRMHSGS